MTDDLVLAIEGGIATLTMNRPEKRNAISGAMIDGLMAAFDQLDRDPTVRVIVIRGAGVAFCSGMDLREMRQRQEGGDADTISVQVFQRIARSHHPTIAMIQGDALAGGCELALHCDLRVASHHARFGMPLARLGLVVPFALGQKLVETVGPAFARQILFTAQPITAQRAWEMGMVHELTSPEDLEAITATLAASIAENAPLSLAGMKAVVDRATAIHASTAHDDIDALVRRARLSDDAREGVQAMLEKRRPNFQGT